MEREEGVFGDEQGRSQRSVRQGSDAGPGDDGGDGSAREGGGDKVMSVEALAAHCEEQLAGSHGARVDGVTEGNQCAGIRDRGRRFKHRAGADCRLCQGQIHCASKG
jgi:hypothetical protein